MAIARLRAPRVGSPPRSGKSDGRPAARPSRSASRPTRRALLATAALLAAPRDHAAATVAQRTVEALLVLPITPPDPPYPWFSIQLTTPEPGSAEPFGRIGGHGVVDVGFVVSRGEIGFEADGPALVARKGGNVLANGVPVAAGSVTVLQPGDQAVTGSGVGSRRRNADTVQAETFELPATDFGEISVTHDGIWFDDPAAPTFPTVFPDGTPARHAVATLVRVVLPPGVQWRWGGLLDAVMLAVVDGPIDLYSGANPLVTYELGNAPKPLIRMQTWFGMAASSTLFAPATIFRSGTDHATTMLVATLSPATP